MKKIKKMFSKKQVSGRQVAAARLKKTPKVAVVDEGDSFSAVFDEINEAYLKEELESFRKMEIIID